MITTRLQAGMAMATAVSLLLQAQAFAMTITNLDKKPRRVAIRCAQTTATGEKVGANCNYCYSLENVISPGKSRTYNCASGAAFSIGLRKQTLDVTPLSKVIIRGGKLHIE